VGEEFCVPVSVECSQHKCHSAFRPEMTKLRKIGKPTLRYSLRKDYCLARISFSRPINNENDKNTINYKVDQKRLKMLLSILFREPVTFSEYFFLLC
jgi:hypothetical protein